MINFWFLCNVTELGGTLYGCVLEYMDVLSI